MLTGAGSLADAGASRVRQHSPGAKARNHRSVIGCASFDESTLACARENHILNVWEKEF